MGYSYLSFSFCAYLFVLFLLFIYFCSLFYTEYGQTTQIYILGDLWSHMFWLSLYLYLCSVREFLQRTMLTFRHIFNISKRGTSSVTVQSNSVEKKCSCALHVSCTPLCRKPKPIIHIEFCLGKLGSTLENKQPETWKLHLYGRKHWCLVDWWKLCHVDILQRQAFWAGYCIEVNGFQSFPTLDKMALWNGPHYQKWNIVLTY